MKPPGDEASEVVVNLDDWRRLTTDFSALEQIRASQLKSGRENQRCLRIVVYLLAATSAATMIMVAGTSVYLALKGSGHETHQPPAEPASVPKADPNPSQGPT